MSKNRYIKYVFQIGDVARKGDTTLANIGKTGNDCEDYGTCGDYDDTELGSPNPRYKEGYTSSDNQNAWIGHG